jgi:hypothetical protein
VQIDALEAIQLGGVTQRIRVRGTNPANPVLLLMQQGPGLPRLAARVLLVGDEDSQYQRPPALVQECTTGRTSLA